MHRRVVAECLSRAAAIGLVLAVTVSAGAVGYWNMPGTHLQHAGWGFGPGYHAPMILGPIRYDGWHAPHEVRLPCAPNPYVCCDCYGYGASCEGCAEQPTALESEVVPPPPIVAPVAAPSNEMPPPQPQATPVAPEPPKSALFSSPVQL